MSITLYSNVKPKQVIEKAMESSQDVCENQVQLLIQNSFCELMLFIYVRLLSSMFLTLYLYTSDFCSSIAFVFLWDIQNSFCGSGLSAHVRNSRQEFTLGYRRSSRERSLWSKPYLPKDVLGLFAFHDEGDTQSK